MNKDWILVVGPQYRQGRGMYSRPNHAGYTNKLSEAGRFSEEDAKSYQVDAPDKYHAELAPEGFGIAERRYICEARVAELESDPDEMCIYDTRKDYPESLRAICYTNYEANMILDAFNSKSETP